MKKQYVYIGQYYHIKDKELPFDYKFGVTDNLREREYSLGRTNSPIKYMILKAWELPYNIKREKVEKLISIVFDDAKYDGCEWYDIDLETFQTKITDLFLTIDEMVDGIDFKFEEVEISVDDTYDDMMQKNIRKRSAWTNLDIKIDDVSFSAQSAKDGFSNAIKEVINRVSTVQLALDFPNIFKKNHSDFAKYKYDKNSLVNINNYYLDTYNNTNIKKSNLEQIFEKYKINGKVSII
jgi:hypothetical protein